jgi:hypothetical protein
LSSVKKTERVCKEVLQEGGYRREEELLVVVVVAEKKVL